MSIYGTYVIVTMERKEISKLNVNQIFDLVAVAAYQERKRAINGNVSFDGRALWGEFKKLLSSDRHVCYADDMRKPKYDWILGLTEYDADGNINESIHFLMQMVRIPRSGDNSFMKALQIAFNVGQKSAMESSGAYNGMESIPSNNPSLYIHENDLNVPVSSFLTTEQISQLYDLILSILNPSN